ncbi:MAG: hypothetical protein Fur0012_11890 [Elusimicrobiota bacterium]
MKEIILKVPSISCAGCENSIRDAFNGIKGIISVEPSHNTKMVKVVYNENEIASEEIKRIIESTGREVEK